MSNQSSDAQSQVPPHPPPLLPPPPVHLPPDLSDSVSGPSGTEMTHLMPTWEGEGTENQVPGILGSDLKGPEPIPSGAKFPETQVLQLVSLENCQAEKIRSYAPSALALGPNLGGCSNSPRDAIQKRLASDRHSCCRGILQAFHPFVLVVSRAEGHGKIGPFV